MSIFLFSVRNYVLHVYNNFWTRYSDDTSYLIINNRTTQKWDYEELFKKETDGRPVFSTYILFEIGRIEMHLTRGPFRFSVRH